MAIRFPLAFILTVGACLISAIVAVTAGEHGFSEKDYSWWAAQPLNDPEVPAADDPDDRWGRNPVDRFVLAKLRESGLEPARAAGPRELARRLYFDMHGLPPTPEQVDAFVAACADDPDRALDGLIDALLASPRYGERWGQHWLDIARYAESDGYRADFFRPEVWRYRDYVIRAFNDDKPYDQFAREQLAADEFAADDPDTVIATAFLRLGIYEYNQRNARMHWELILNEMTNVTGEVFLGLGIGCAQCHDHKFDPILQQDYYSLQAFLSSTWWPENQPLATPDKLARHKSDQRKWEAETAVIRDEIASLLKEARAGKKEFVISQFPGDVQAMYRKPPTARTPREEQLAQLIERQIDHEYGKFESEKALKKKPEQLMRYKELAARLAAFDPIKPEPLPMAFITTDVGTRPAVTVIRKAGGHQEVKPTFLTLLGKPVPAIQPTGKTTGRRGALADWIASSDNPFSTRVIVNRVWQHHFGRGIVATSNDFGMLGDLPSHPDLLDWLTSRFIDGGWRLKSLHRLILSSAAYRQTARREPSASASRKDPSNKLLWRFPARRLSAEQVRDAMLVVSGELVERSGGPSAVGAAPVRSVYVKKIRNTPDPVLHAFDAPSGFDSAPGRLQTTTPTQALLLVNNDWPLQRAHAFATRLLKGKTEITGAEIAAAYRIAYGRDPDGGERARALEFTRAQREDSPSAKPATAPGSERDIVAATTEFCHALLSSNEFLYLH